MSRRRISKDDLQALCARADSVTSLPSRFGTYDALVWVDGQVLRVTTEALNPVGDVVVEEISEDNANKLMAQ